MGPGADGVGSPPGVPRLSPRGTAHHFGGWLWIVPFPAPGITAAASAETEEDWKPTEDDGDHGKERPLQRAPSGGKGALWAAVSRRWFAKALCEGSGGGKGRSSGVAMAAEPPESSAVLLPGLTGASFPDASFFSSLDQACTRVFLKIRVNCDHFKYTLPAF